MESNWGVIGHQNIIKYLENCIARNRLVHTYLFYGIRHLGKTTVAIKFADRLLNQPGASKTDLFELKLTEGKKDISIEQIRDWQHWLSLKSFGHGYKVGIVHQVERLNRNSATALLKTIEEPAARTIIILITSAHDSLLPTITSRSQKIHFLPVATKTIQQFVAGRLADQRQAQTISQFSFGRPGVARKFLDDGEYYAAYLGLHQKVESLWQQSLAERFIFLENFLVGKSHQSNLTLLKQFLQHFEIIFRQKMLSGQGSWQLLQLADLSAQTRSILHSNIQPRLALENLLIHL